MKISIALTALLTVSAFAEEGGSSHYLPGSLDYDAPLSFNGSIGKTHIIYTGKK